MARFAILVIALFAAVSDEIPKEQAPVVFTTGPQRFRQGDGIKITQIRSTSPNLQRGDCVTVVGTYTLHSRQHAKLCLFMTSKQPSRRRNIERTQTKKIASGTNEFELTTKVRVDGQLHVSFYDPISGKPFGGVYFGGKTKIREISGLNLDYYLDD